jgi:hypothetical protein
MIDIRNETTIWANDVPKMLPPGRGGKRMHLSSVIRAILAKDETRRLEALRVGSRWLTSVEAVQRWMERQTADRLGTTPPADAAPRPPAARRRAHERAEAELSRAGF